MMVARMLKLLGFTEVCFWIASLDENLALAADKPQNMSVWKSCNIHLQKCCAVLPSLI